MPRVSVRDFSGGWWAMGTKDDNPPTTLRRAKGISSLKTKSILSRWGSTQLYNLNAHSLFRFAGVRFQGAGAVLYRDGVAVKAGLTGSRLSFVRMPPGPSDPDYLFVAGGGSLFKVDQAGAVTNWGLDPPADGFTATVSVPKSKVMESFEDSTTWTAVSCVLANEATIKQVGVNSMRMTLNSGVTGTATKAIVKDFNHYDDGTLSPDQDFVSLWIRVDNPSNLVSLDIAFDVGNGDFASDFYTYPVRVVDQIPPSTQLVDQIVGIGSISGFENIVVEDFNDSTFKSAGIFPFITSLGQTTIVTAIGTWVRLRIPKITFNRTGTNGATFRDVKAVRITAVTGGPVVIYLDSLEVIGQTGLQGTYQYHVTFKNSTTGVRSNANPTAVTAEKVMRSTVVLANLPASADPQVDKLEIWRTVGNGVLFFLIDTIDKTAGTYTDRVADFAGLDSSPGAKLMQVDQLPTNNIRPDATIGFAFGPFQGCMFTCGNTADGTRGRVYYSPIGRPEGVTNFLTVTSDDDRTQSGCIWNGSGWVFSQAHLYQIQGDGTVFTYTEVAGVIGTIDPFSVEVTPIGIFYQAKDGLRLFNGIESRLIGEAHLGAIYRGETIEGVGPFEGVDAAYGKNQYLVTDAVGQTLAFNYVDGTWRYFGLGLGTIFYEPDTGLVIATLAGKVVILEDNLVETDNGASIPFEVEIPSVATSIEHTGLFQRLYLKLNTQNQLLTPTIIIDGVEYVVPVISTASAPGSSGTTIEIPIMRNGLSVGVRLAGNLTKRVEVVEVAADLYLSEGVVQAEKSLHGIQQVMGTGA